MAGTHDKAAESVKPSVTIILPVRNEAAFIAQSLSAVLKQDYPSECVEVLVIDGMSDDSTGEIILDIIARNTGRTIRLLENPNRFTPHAFNIGVREADGDIIIIVGGHSELAEDYVSGCIKALYTSGADCVGGVVNTVGETTVARAIALAQSSWFGVGGVAFRTGREKGQYVDTVAFGAYRRDVFARIGLFDEELRRNQDDEFNFRLTQAGGKIWLDPSIRVVYYSRASLKKLWHQYFQYGFFKVRVIQKRKAVPSWRHLIPALFVLALGLSFGLALFTGNWLWGVVVAGPYLAANLSISLWTSWKDIRTLPLLPLAFLILHLSYGIGFLWGLWRWRHTWRKQADAQSIAMLNNKIKTENPPS